MKTLVLLFGTLLMVACGTDHQHAMIVPPTIIKSPDFSKLSASGCKHKETIKTPVILSLDKQGKVTKVRGLTVRDKQLASQIITQFKQARYTPYLQGGKPIARNLNVVISLQCP